MKKSDAIKQIDTWLSSTSEITGASIIKFLQDNKIMQPPAYFEDQETLWFMEDEEEYAYDNPTRDYALVGKHTDRSRYINERYIAGASIEELADEQNVTRTRIKTIIHRAIRGYIRLSKLEQALTKVKNNEENN